MFSLVNMVQSDSANDSIVTKMFKTDVLSSYAIWFVDLPSRISSSSHPTASSASSYSNPTPHPGRHPITHSRASERLHIYRGI